MSETTIDDVYASDLKVFQDYSETIVRAQLGLTKSRANLRTSAQARAKQHKQELWQCSRTKCGWLGLDKDKKEIPDKKFGMGGTILICPTCDCESFYRVKAIP